MPSADPLKPAKSEVTRQIMHALGRCAGRPATDWLVRAAGPREDRTRRRGWRVTPGIEAAFAPAGSRLPFHLARQTRAAPSTVRHRTVPRDLRHSVVCEAGRRHEATG